MQQDYPAKQIDQMMRKKKIKARKEREINIMQQDYPTEQIDAQTPHLTQQVNKGYAHLNACCEGSEPPIEVRAGKLHNTNINHQDSTGMDEIQISFNDDDAKCWRLVRQQEAHDEMEEMIFTVTGAIGSIDLPPILKETLIHFEGMVKALKEIGQKCKREFWQGKLQEWMPSKVQGYVTIQLSNQYFQPRGQDYRGVDLSLSANMDSKGILRCMAGENMVHTEDNEVKPQMFRIGDLMEAQCLVVFVNYKGGIRMKVIL
ncbi:hypothetical protein ARMGADRAFT_1034528 [Armillaria gallica]|uniref:Uncharacterized protein n=1 Tax=Armillaria gallica TaxID=47427 RepID=A0A2H3CX34_ARMGA|nr:hypothetical protein ARMGADRAFT_1034528 [Armillaria gallica]